jgi:hypothetical protein
LRCKESKKCKHVHTKRNASVRERPGAHEMGKDENVGSQICNVMANYGYVTVEGEECAHEIECEKLNAWR